jgi:hypothetical protein
MYEMEERVFKFGDQANSMMVIMNGVLEIDITDGD